MSDTEKPKVIFASQKAFNSPTPAGLNLWIKVITVIAVAFLGWLTTATIMGPHSKDVVTQITSLVVVMLNAVSPFFGVNTTEKSVPVENVAAMDVE